MNLRSIPRIAYNHPIEDFLGYWGGTEESLSGTKRKTIEQRRWNLIFFESIYI
jgi:hypothetical protein